MENQETTSGKIFYVNIEKGSARGAGTIEAPMKDIQKAIDSAADGDVIRIAQGNYLGTMDRGWIQIKGKYISLEGGWNDDFTERNPVRYITRIQPSVAQRGTIGQGLLMIESISNRNARIVVDGIFFDLGLVHEYAKADPTDERFGCPEGCETGRIMPVGNPPNKTIRLIGGKVAGKLVIRNCMFLNASFNGIIMTNMGGDWEICNNVFVSNLYASCEITGGLNQATGAHRWKAWDTDTASETVQTTMSITTYSDATISGHWMPDGMTPTCLQTSARSAPHTTTSSS